MIFFMRHGQSEHNLDEPKSFNLKNPKLTNKGKQNTRNMRGYIDDNSQFLLILVVFFGMMKTRDEKN